MADPQSYEGTTYTAPVALYGMALESYANFLIDYPNLNRIEEASKLMKNACSAAYDVYGPVSEPIVNMMNNFAVKCIQVNRFVEFFYGYFFSCIVMGIVTSI